MAGGTIGYEAITVSSTAIGVDTSWGGLMPAAALVTVETNPIRFRTDGTAPTSSEGHLINAGGTFLVEGPGDVYNLRMIRTGSDATVRVTYYGTIPGT